MTDFPIIQLRPTPSDAELEAERDAKHAAAVREWINPWCVCGHRFGSHRAGWCRGGVDPFAVFTGGTCPCKGFTE